MWTPCPSHPSFWHPSCPQTPEIIYADSLGLEGVPVRVSKSLLVIITSSRVERFWSGGLAAKLTLLAKWSLAQPLSAWEENLGRLSSIPEPDSTSIKWGENT